MLTDEEFVRLGKNRTWRQWLTVIACSWGRSLGMQVLLYLSIAYWMVMLNSMGCIKL